MNHNYRLALLATTATMVAGAVIAALGAPVSVIVLVAIGGAMAVIIALSRSIVAGTVRALHIDLQATHLGSAVSIAATAGDMPIFWSEHAIAPETLAVIQHTISSFSAPRVRDFPDLHFRIVGVCRGLFVASVRRSSLDLLPT